MSESLLARNARQILATALNSPLGIEITVSDPAKTTMTPTFTAKQILYRFKKENRDFDVLSIRFHPLDPDNKLRIWKNV